MRKEWEIKEGGKGGGRRKDDYTTHSLIGPNGSPFCAVLFPIMFIWHLFIMIIHFFFSSSKLSLPSWMAVCSATW